MTRRKTTKRPTGLIPLIQTAFESNYLDLSLTSLVDAVPFAADPASVAVIFGSTDSGFILFMLLIIVLLSGVTDWAVAVVGKDI